MDECGARRGHPGRLGRRRRAPREDTGLAGDGEAHLTASAIDDQLRVARALDLAIGDLRRVADRATACAGRAYAADIERVVPTFFLTITDQHDLSGLEEIVHPRARLAGLCLLQ